MNYQDFIQKKSQLAYGQGFNPNFMPGFLFDFQSFLVDWSIRTGRTAIFADCGMGKTPMQLVWAENVVRHTNRPVLILAPLSVSVQTVQEAGKFDIDAARVNDGKHGGKARVIVTNYERLHHFDPSDFSGVVCDESSIIKNFDGARKGEITEFMKKTQYRLLCTATASPNDYIELGTSSEALGYLGFMDMLAMFFKNDEDSLHPAFIGSKWRFKRHAERDFWRWVSSWARACRKPSDLGFPDGDFILPPLVERQHCVESPARAGYLLYVPTRTLQEEREDTRETVQGRCELAARILSESETGIAWCHLNAEADTMVSMMPGSVQVKGSDCDDRKEELLMAFSSGQIKKLVTKPKIAAFGMNWQHCSHMTYFATHSFEQYYQAIRRCWRFGQKNAVCVDTITTQAQNGVLQNMQRKEAACEEMFSQLVKQMNEALAINRMSTFKEKEELPQWL